MLNLHYSEYILKQTLNSLCDGGQEKRECIVLWLGKKSGSTISVSEVLMPRHYAETDYFHIDRSSMLEIQTYIRENRLMIAAQVHTHPMQAFHSKADDDWAFIRHVDALSIVLPYFAKNISSDNFMEEAAVFKLSEKNTWDHIKGEELTKRCALTY